MSDMLHEVRRYGDGLRELKPEIPKVTEGAVVNACIRWLWAQGCYAWRNNTGAYRPEGSARFIRYGKKGSGDVIAVTPTGKFLMCECKAGKNKQSPAQVIFQQQIEARRGIYIVAYSVDDLEARKAEILG